MNEHMRADKRIPFLLALLALSILVLFSFSGTPHDKMRGNAIVRRVPDPEVAAHAYLVRLVGAQNPLLKRREEKRLAPASLTKLMTALLAEEELGPGEKITFLPEAKKAEEKISDASAGEVFVRDDMLRFLLIASDNDAAMALAAAVGKKLGGGTFDDCIGRFVDMMNKKAGLLALANTHFQNPTGLDAEGHYTSAHDLAKIAEYVLAHHPHLWEISRTTDTVVYSFAGIPHAVKTTDELLYEFPGILGSKTGLTDNAKGALILLYPVRTRGTAIIIILKSEDRFGDGRKFINWLEAN